MEVHGVLLDVQAQIVSRIVDPTSGEAGDAVGRLRARHEPVTASNLAHEVLDAGSQAQSERGELFGDQHGATDGIAELARHDANGDRRIDAFDPVWVHLGLMDGSGSVRGLDAAGFTGVDLTRRGTHGTTAAGDAYRGAVAFERGDGSRATAVDVWLGSSDPS